MSKKESPIVRDHERGAVVNAAELAELRAEIERLREARAQLERKAETLQQACRTAYRHLDTYGTVEGGSEPEMQSQAAVFEALRPLV